jgi:hypothetical protein
MTNSFNQVRYLEITKTHYYQYQIHSRQHHTQGLPVGKLEQCNVCILLILHLI